MKFDVQNQSNITNHLEKKEQKLFNIDILKKYLYKEYKFQTEQKLIEKDLDLDSFKDMINKIDKEMINYFSLKEKNSNKKLFFKLDLDSAYNFIRTPPPLKEDLKHLNKAGQHILDQNRCIYITKELHSYTKNNKDFFDYHIRIDIVDGSR